MKYAVITSGGKQYKVTEGQILELDKLEAAPGASYTFDGVLLTVDGEDVQVGTPYLENVVVTAKVLDHVQGDKIRVAKFKAKVRYRKVMGFRAKLTKVIIESLSVNPEKKTASK